MGNALASLASGLQILVQDRGFYSLGEGIVLNSAYMVPTQVGRN